MLLLRGGYKVEDWLLEDGRRTKGGKKFQNFVAA